MAVLIRRANPKDLVELNRLNLLLHKFLQKIMQRKLSKEKIEQEKFDKKDLKRIFVAKIGKELAGFASFSPSAFDTEWNEKCIELEEIFVKPEHSKKGIGKALLKKIVKEAKKKKVNIIVTVTKENKRAIEFYKQHGFEITSHKMLLNIINSKNKKYREGHL